MLTVTAVNTAFASSEHKFKIFENQPLFWPSFDSAAAATFIVVVFVIVVDDSNDVSGSSLQGGSTHFETEDKIEEDLKGETPKTPRTVADVPEAQAVDLITEIKPRTIGLFEFSPIISPAIFSNREGLRRPEW